MDLRPELILFAIKELVRNRNVIQNRRSSFSLKAFDLGSAPKSYFSHGLNLNFDVSVYRSSDKINLPLAAKHNSSKVMITDIVPRMLITVNLINVSVSGKYNCASRCIICNQKNDDV